MHFRLGAFTKLMAVDLAVQDHLIEDVIEIGYACLSLLAALIQLLTVLILIFLRIRNIDMGTIHGKNKMILELNQVMLICVKVLYMKVT
jgi:hypothetical protein